MAFSDQQALLSIAPIGQIKITAHEALPNQRKGPFLTFETQDGALLKRIDFDYSGPEEYPNIVRFRIFNQSNMPGPLIAAVNTSVGGSAIIFEALIIGIIDGKISELSDRIEGQSINCLYIGKFGHYPSISFLYLDDVPAGDEIHYAPHRYQEKLYTWRGDKFVLVSERKTKSKYKYCGDAAVELGYHCQHEIFSELNPYKGK